MSAIMKGGIFKHVLLKQQQPGYENLRPHGGGADFNPIAACDGCFAFVDAAGGAGATVAAVQVNDAGKERSQPVSLVWTGAEVRDLSFNPFVPGQLATAGADGVVKLWDLPFGSDVCEEGISQPVGVYQAAGDAPRGVVWHQSASSILAVQCLRSVVVWDIQNPAAPAFSVRMGSDDLCSLEWSYDGDLLVSTDRGKRLRLTDPRQGIAAAAEASNVHGGGATRAIWCPGPASAESGGRVLSTGISAATREREMAFWDCRNLDKPIKRERLGGSSSGYVLPLLDAASGLLLLCGRGDTGVRVFEWDSSAAAASSTTTAATAAPLPICNAQGLGSVARGYALLPRSNLDLMGCEVARLLRLVDGAVEVVRLEVPRRDKRVFHAELYPPAPGPYPSLTAEDWLAGHTLPPYLVAADALAAASAAAAEAASSAAGAAAAELAEAEAAFAPLPPAAVPLPRSTSPNSESANYSIDCAPPPPSLASSLDDSAASASERAVALGLGAFSSGSGMLRFRHVFGKETPNQKQTYNFKPDLTSLDEPGMACSERFWAVPLVGGGGPVLVAPVGAQGAKLEVGHPVVNGHRATVTSIAFNPFDAFVMATGGEDANVCLWRVPDGGPEASMGVEDALAQLSGNNAPVRHVEWHPTADGVIMTTATDNTVRLFDVSAGGEPALILRCHGQQIHSAAFSGDGALVATSCRDGLIRLLDPRAGDAPIGTAPGHEGPRAQRVSWWFNSKAAGVQYLVTTGCGKAAQRQLTLWDPRMLETPLNLVTVDHGNGTLFPMLSEATGLLFLAGRGDTAIRFFELEALAGQASPKAAEANGNGGGGSSDLLSPKFTYCHDYKCGAEPLWGAALLPPAPGALDVASVETARMLRLTAAGAVEPISFFLPRAEDLKPYFQDDVYADVRSAPPACSAAEWFEGATEQKFTPSLSSLRPAGMPLLSERPPPEKKVSKAKQFREELDRQERATKALEDEMRRLQDLAAQNEQFNPNLSMGVRRGVDQKPIPNAEEDDWSD